MRTRRASNVASDATVGFGSALRDRTFVFLFAAEAQSSIGDQLARVALAVLVFRTTGSVSATAGAYAATLLPATLGGLVLSRLGDRFPRRHLMVVLDLIRAAAFATMAIPSLPVLVVVLLVVVAVTLGPVFTAAQVSTLAERLTPDVFGAANGLRLAFSQLTQVAGFVLGGIVVAFTGARFALLLNGVTFLLSALLVASVARGAVGAGRAVTVTQQAATQPAPDAPRRRPSTGLWQDRKLRRLAILTLLAGLFVVPEGLTVPFGEETGSTTVEIGALFAAGASGGVIGALLIVRLRRRFRRDTLAAWLAVCCGLPLLATALTNDWRIAAGLWLVSGMFSAYMVDATTIIVQAIPNDHRAHLVGILSALVLAAQGVCLIVFGALAELTSPGVAVSLAGALGTLAALATIVFPGRRAYPGGSDGGTSAATEPGPFVRTTPAP